MVKTNLVILFELLYGSLKILSLAVWNLLGRCALRHASCLGYCTTLPLDSSLLERDWCKTEVLLRELFLSTLGTYLLFDICTLLA